jgi:predicted ribosomally synthesized peptide with SipW-like signal peptide
MTDQRIELTRRKLLAASGAVGAAGAGAGLGTSALFNDTESFGNNSITAGTFDMSVAAEVVAANQYWANRVDLGELAATADGEAVTGLRVADVKPGDWGIICFDVSIGENPGYVRVRTTNLRNEENGYEEPEPDSADEGDRSDPGDPDGKGELEYAILSTIWREYDDSGDRTGLSHLDGTTNEDGTGGPVRGSRPDHGWDRARRPGGVVPGTDPQVVYTDFDTVFDTYATGVTLGGSDEPIVVGSGDDAVTFYLLLEIPVEVGNEIQGDSLAFDLVFEAEQARNNGDPVDTDPGPLVIDDQTAGAPPG